MRTIFHRTSSNLAGPFGPVFHKSHVCQSRCNQNEVSIGWLANFLSLLRKPTFFCWLSCCQLFALYWQTIYFCVSILRDAVMMQNSF